MPRFALIFAVAAVAIAGCIPPKVVVKKDPGPHTKGVRYYRPKPYLFVAPAMITTGTGGTAVSVPSDEFVSLEL